MIGDVHVKHPKTTTQTRSTSLQRKLCLIIICMLLQINYTLENTT